MANGRCLVCQHPERVRAELLVAGGASARSVAAKFNLSPYSVHRHMHGHVTAERMAALKFGPVAREALNARVAEESSSVIDHFRAVRAGLYALYDSAVTAGDRNGGALLAGKLIEVLNAMARMTGELAQSPLVQLNQTNVFINDPAFASFQADLIRVLSRFPEARTAVLAEFERIETAAPSRLPALEHQADADETA